ncbi:hypothetical protein BOX15_Mlig015833g2 [Macrostomum lignano]|uniref:Aquaporin n=1 Tax=Macrostomum lignano TaxID=282301 RepID=A0A267E509_9PLAT|nr:hypothetical protein BOX15_Mlig015833g2 [Macrostomum lignano]
MPAEDRRRLTWSRVESRLVLRHRPSQLFLSELIGTVVLVIIVDLGCGLATITQRGGIKNFVPAVGIGNGLGAMTGIMVSLRLSGGHINPAVSFAMFTLRKMSFKHLLLYQWAQYLGGFLGAMVVNLLYFQIFNNLNGGQLVAFGPNGTAGTFFTLPNPAINNGVAFADQVVGTSLLLLAVRAITDPNNLNTPPALQPLLIGLVIMGLIISEVIVSGTCLNPARDFAPRLATLALGYGPEVLSSRSFYFLVPLVGPYVGAVLGAWVYELAYAKPLQLLVEQEAAAALNEDHANDDEDFPTARVQQPHLQQRTPILASATKRRPCDDEDSVKAESLRHAATASLEEKAEC